MGRKGSHTVARERLCSNEVGGEVILLVGTQCKQKLYIILRLCVGVGRWE